MKIAYIKHVLLGAIILANAAPGFLSAQTRLKEGENKISQRVYVVKKMEKYGGRLNISEENNTLAAAIEADPVGLGWIDNAEFAGDATVPSVVLKTMGEARLKELQGKGEKAIMIDIYINHSGQVEAVQFRTRGGTELSLEEIDGLAVAIKRDISIKIPPGLDSTKPIVPITYVANFERLLGKR